MKVSEYIQILNSGSVKEKLQVGIMNLDVLFPNGVGKDEFIRLSKMKKVLSEEFMEEYSDKLNWGLISIYQKLSEGFIERHLDKINLDLIRENKKIKLSDDFKKSHNIKIKV